MTNIKLLKTNYKKLRISLFLVLLLSCLFINKAYSQTTTVTVNGNTTTTTTITNTPITTVNTPNTPNIGDITTTTTNQTTTDIATKVANTNSGNLVSTNFCDNSWTGTQKTSSPVGSTSDLGCNYITGKTVETYLQTEKNLTNSGITQAEQNLGFTQSASAHTYHYWNWNSYLNFSHSVINNDTGGTITQNRTYSGNNSTPGSIKSLDTIIIGENSASGFTSKMRFDSSSSGGGATWQGVDIRDPNLSITYNKLTSTSSSLQTTTTSIISCESLGTCYVAPVVSVAVITPIITTVVEPTVAAIITPVVEIIESPIVIQQAAVADMKEATPILFANPEPTATVSSTVSSGATTLTTPEPTATVSSGATTPTSSEATSTVSSNVSSGATTPTSSETTSTVSSGATTSTSSEATSTKESNANTTSTTQETASSSQKTDTKTESNSEKSSTSTTQSAATENTKTEGSSTKTSSSENVSNEKGSTTASGSINTSNATPKDEKISVSVKAAVEKVERELKNIGDKTKAIQEIKLDGIKAGSPNLGTYENRAFYEPKYYNGVPNPDFYLQADIAQKPVYANVTLAAYTNNDPIGKQQAAMQEIQDEMNDIIIQLEQLKRK